MNDDFLFYDLILVLVCLLWNVIPAPYINARCEIAPPLIPVSPYKDRVVAAARTSDNVLVYYRLIMFAAFSIKLAPKRWELPIFTILI